MSDETNRIATLSPGDADDHVMDDLLHYIEPRHGSCQAELQALAQHLYPRARGQDAMLTEDSRLAFVTLCGYLFDNHQEEDDLGFPFASRPTISAVGRLAISADADREMSHRRLLSSLMLRPFLTEWTQSGFLQLLQLSERRLCLVMQTLSDGLHDIAQRAPRSIH